MDYLVYLLIVICIYVILTVSLNSLVGEARIFSFAHAAFFGIGAYATSILMVKGGWNFFPALGAAFVVTGCIAAVSGIPALRLGGDYFVLACFALQIIVERILNNWESLTGGPYGLYGIPRPSLFGHVLTDNRSFVLLALAIAGIVVWAYGRWMKSPYGLTIRTLAEDEVVAASMGRDVTRVKVVLFAITAATAALAGGLYAVLYGVVDPTAFGIHVIILLWAMLFVGGMGNLKGPILGAVVLLCLPEALRFIGVQGAKTGQVQQMAYGLFLVGAMLFRPQGLAGEHRAE
jgi:branched-chain amino acid transport system permease protein